MTIENIGANNLLWTPVDRAEHQASRRTTLLSGTALAAGVIAGMFFMPSGAIAACSFGNTTICTDTTTTESGTANNSNPDRRDRRENVIVNPNAIVNGRGLGANGRLANRDANLTNSGNVSSTVTGVNGVDVRGYNPLGSLALGDATYSGKGNVSGQQDGINLDGVDSKATVTGGTIKGTDGTGIKAKALKDAKVDLLGANVSGGVDGVNLNGEASANATVIGGSVTGTAGNGLTLNSLVNATADLTSTDISGGKDGVNLDGKVSANATVIGGSVTGTAGNGLTLNSVGNATADLTSTDILGGKDGVNLTGGLAGATATVTNSSVTGDTGNGITATSLTGGAKADLNKSAIIGGKDGVNLNSGLGAVVEMTGGSVTGGANGLNLISTDVDVNLIGGSITGHDSDGIKSVATGVVVLGGTTNIETLGTEILGNENGINATTIGGGVDASTSIIVNGSSVTGTNGSGISALTIAGTLGSTKDAVTEVKGSADITGGTIGILAGSGSINGDATTIVNVSGDIKGDTGGVIAVAGSINATDPAALLNLVSNPTDIASLANLAAGSGTATIDIKVENVTADNGVGILAVGLGTNNTVDVSSSGTVTAANGIGVLAGSIGKEGDVNLIVNNVTSGIAGAVAFNTDGNANVTATGEVEFDSLVGIGAVALNGGNATATLSSTGGVSSNGGLIGVVAISDGGNATANVDGKIASTLIGSGSIARGSDTAKNSTSGSIDADLLGVVSLNLGNGRAVIDSSSNLQSSAGTGLVGLAAVKVGNEKPGGKPDVKIKNNGNIKDYEIGIAGVGDGKSNQINIDNHGNITAGLVGISGVGIGDDSDVIIRNRGVINTDGVGIAGVTTGDNGNILINNTDRINASAAGLTGVAAGKDSDVTIKNSGVINTDGIGVTGVTIGANGNVLINNTSRINAGVAGLTGVAVGDTSTVTIKNTDKITTDGAGISGVTSGDNSVVKVSTNGNVNAGLSGVTGFVDGKQGKVVVDTNAKVTSKGVGVSGGASGEGSKVNVTTHQAVSGDVLGVGGLLFGDDHKLKITTADKVTSDHGIAVGTASAGDNNTIRINTEKSVQGDLGGIDILAVGHENKIFINPQDTVSSAHGVGIGSIIVGDDNLIKVRPAKTVSGDLGGIGIAAVGDRNIVDIITKDNVTSANGFGVVGSAIGDEDNTVTIITKGQVDGKYLGVGGIVGGDNGELTIITEKAVNSSSGFGVTGLGIGDDQQVTVRTEAAVNGDGLGVGAQVIGQGNVTITTEGKVTSASGIGVSGGAVGTGPSTVDITTQKSVDGKLVGVAGNIGGDGSALTVTTEKAVTSSSGVGIATASAGNKNTVEINAGGQVEGDEAGILALTVGDETDVNITTKKVVANDGVGVLATTIGDDGTLNITTDGTVTATASGVIGMNSGGSTNIQINKAVTVLPGGEFGAFALGGGSGTANIYVDGAISGAKTGAFAATIGSGDATVISTARVSASELGLGGSNIGTGNIALSNEAVISSDGSGIAAVKTGASGSVTVNVDANIRGLTSNATGGDGVLVISSTIGAGAVDVYLDDSVSINSEESGINVIKTTGDDDVTITLGDKSRINADYAGVNAASLLGDGDVIINTGESSKVDAGIGIVATKGLGKGDVDISLGEDSRTSGYIGVMANNAANNGNVQLDLADGGRIISNRIGVEAGSLHGDVTVTADADTRIIAQHGQAIIAAANGEVDITTAGFVLGEGSDTTAVVTIRSGDGASYLNEADGVVSSIDEDEAKLAVDAKGAALNFINDGTLIGRVDLTSNDDVLHNNSSNSWYVAGVSDFGVGDDLLTNAGKIQTSFYGMGGEFAEFRNLENFTNGDLLGIESGTMTMQGEIYGLLGFDALRDVTITGGNYEGVGNATLAVDAYLGQAGSTSDMLIVEGRADGKTTLDLRNMNGGPLVLNSDGIQFADAYEGIAAHDTFIFDPNGVNIVNRNGVDVYKGPQDFLFFGEISRKSTSTADNPNSVGGFIDPVADREVYELPALVSGAQSIWHETSGVWLDRQADLRNQLGSAETLPEGYVSKDGPIAVPQTNGNVTPGVWAKAVGSWTNRDKNVSFSTRANNYSYDIGYKQNTYGVIAGIDFGSEDVYTSGDALIFGIMGGYLSSDLDFKASSTSADYTGGTVGIYGTYLNNGFFADALVKADFLKMDYSTTMGISETANVNTYGFTLDTGYRFDLKNNLFLEPVATLAYAKTSMDGLSNIPGANIAFPNNDSLRGSLGLRFGGEVVANEKYRMEASVTGRVWNEFNANNHINIHSGVISEPYADDFKGAFGEVGGLLNIQATSNNWSGFVSGSYKFNGDVKSGSVRGGVRFQW